MYVRWCQRPTRYLAPTEWRRFLHYSVHVKVLDVARSEHWGMTIDPRLLWRLSVTRPPASEPFLKVVTMEYFHRAASMEDDLLAILSLLSSNLRRLRLSFMPECSEALQAILHMAVHRFPQLTSLNIVPTHSDWNDARNSIMHLMPVGFSNLVKINSEFTVGEGAFQVLATLEKLRGTRSLASCCFGLVSEQDAFRRIPGAAGD